MKQRITIPDKVTHTVFSLPCVTVILKDDYEPSPYKYHLIVVLGRRKTAHVAYPGDALVEDNNGIWHLKRRQK